MDERESILIVDDDESSRRILTLLLEKKGYETEMAGTGREALEKVLSEIKKNGTLVLEGAHTHYANIEDTTEHGYAQAQLSRFSQVLEEIRKQGFEVPVPHTACTAAAILFPETYFELVRVGIGMYGLWPSKETYVSALQKGKDPLKLEPVMTWKTVVAQAKEVYGAPIIMGMVGVKDRFGESGAPWELIKEFEVSAEHIAQKAKELCDFRSQQ